MLTVLLMFVILLKEPVKIRVLLNISAVKLLYELVLVLDVFGVDLDLVVD